MTTPTTTPTTTVKAQADTLATGTSATLSTDQTTDGPLSTTEIHAETTPGTAPTATLGSSTTFSSDKAPPVTIPTGTAAILLNDQTKTGSSSITQIHMETTPGTSPTANLGSVIASILPTDTNIPATSETVQTNAVTTFFSDKAKADTVDTGTAVILLTDQTMTWPSSTARIRAETTPGTAPTATSGSTIASPLPMDTNIPATSETVQTHAVTTISSGKAPADTVPTGTATTLSTDQTMTWPSSTAQIRAETTPGTAPTATSGSVIASRLPMDTNIPAASETVQTHTENTISSGKAPPDTITTGTAAILSKDQTMTGPSSITQIHVETTGRAQTSALGPVIASTLPTDINIPATSETVQTHAVTTMISDKEQADTVGTGTAVTLSTDQTITLLSSTAKEHAETTPGTAPTATLSSGTSDTLPTHTKLTSTAGMLQTHLVITGTSGTAPTTALGTETADTLTKDSTIKLGAVTPSATTTVMERITSKIPAVTIDTGTSIKSSDITTSLGINPTEQNARQIELLEEIEKKYKEGQLEMEKKFEEGLPEVMAGRARLKAKEFPLSETEATIGHVVRDIGCTVIICACSASIAIGLLLRNFSTERGIHFCQEVCMIIEHIIMITPLRTRNTEKMYACYLASLGMQFFGVATFAFTLMEAVNIYGILTNVVFKGDFYSIKTYILSGFIMTVIVFTSAIQLYDFYPSQWTCWINWDVTAVCSVYMVSVVVLGTAAVVIAESSGMYKTIVIPRNRERVYLARLSRLSVIFFVPLYWLSEVVGSYAMHKMDLSLMGTAFTVNICTAVYVFVMHTIGDRKVLCSMATLMAIARNDVTSQLIILNADPEYT